MCEEVTIGNYYPYPDQIEELAEPLNFQISPNPAKNYFRIATSSSIKSIEVFDLLGHLISSAVYTNQQSIKVNLDGIEPGVYLVTIHSSNGNETKRLVVE